MTVGSAGALVQSYRFLVLDDHGPKRVLWTDDLPDLVPFARRRGALSERRVQAWGADFWAHGEAPVAHRDPLELDANERGVALAQRLLDDLAPDPAVLEATLGLIKVLKEAEREAQRVVDLFEPENLEVGDEVGLSRLPGQRWNAHDRKTRRARIVEIGGWANERRRRPGSQAKGKFGALPLPENDVNSGDYVPIRRKGGSKIRVDVEMEPGTWEPFAVGLDKISGYWDEVVRHADKSRELWRMKRHYESLQAAFSKRLDLFIRALAWDGSEDYRADEGDPERAPIARTAFRNATYQRVFSSAQLLRLLHRATAAGSSGIEDALGGVAAAVPWPAPSRSEVLEEALRDVLGRLQGLYGVEDVEAVRKVLLDVAVDWGRVLVRYEPRPEPFAASPPPTSTSYDVDYGSEVWTLQVDALGARLVTEDGTYVWTMDRVLEGDDWTLNVEPALVALRALGARFAEPGGES